MPVLLVVVPLPFRNLAAASRLVSGAGPNLTMLRGVFFHALSGLSLQVQGSKIAVPRWSASSLSCGTFCNQARKQIHKRLHNEPFGLWTPYRCPNLNRCGQGHQIINQSVQGCRQTLAWERHLQIHLCTSAGQSHAFAPSWQCSGDISVLVL